MHFSVSEDSQKAYLFVLEELYWGEQFLIKNLPELKSGANSALLTDLIETFYVETLLRVEQLKALFSNVETDPAEKECESIYGLIDETVDYFSQFPQRSNLRDILILSSIQKIISYLLETYRLLLALTSEPNPEKLLSLFNSLSLFSLKTNEAGRQLGARWK